MLSASQLTGLQPPPLLEVQPGFPLHRGCADAFAAMAKAANADGIGLQIISGWRDFQRQQQIVSAKLSGLRPLYDLDGNQLVLDPQQRLPWLEAVLLYSALPGASRHHWGTDFDVFDNAAVAPGYQVQLQPAEYEQNGPFADLSDWLTQHAGHYGFFRPYRYYRQGVAPEPWHLSYRPLASQYLPALTLELLTETLSNSQLPDLALILSQLPALYRRYVINISE
jgi:LAS superfamily LD-carboxypeptidase LdcB